MIVTLLKEDKERDQEYQIDGIFAQIQKKTKS